MLAGKHDRQRQRLPEIRRAIRPSASLADYRTGGLHSLHAKRHAAGAGADVRTYGRIVAPPLATEQPHKLS